MRVLVTGGYGCIGSWVVKRLMERRDEVWVYDLREDARRMAQIMPLEMLSRIRFVPGDITDLDDFRSALDSKRVSHVIHLAGLQVPVCRADPLRGARVNVLGTLTVLEAVRGLGRQIEGLVYASSAGVYGPPDTLPAGPLPDDTPLRPLTHYGVFKACNEGNARVYWLDHGIRSVGLRPWTVYGVGRDFGMTSDPTKAIKAVAAGRRFHIGYGGLQDMQYADDVAGAFIRGVVECHRLPEARVYNIRGEVVAMPEFLATLAGAAPEATRLISAGQNQLPIAFDLDDQRLRAEIGHIPRTPLAQGVAQTLACFRTLRAEGRLDLSDLGPEPATTATTAKG
ncbi:MAG TPA: NAD(P)-dependent oxidoreductase [Gemmataceae bacterium]|jgi:nucleoside-diphosphate-sugar epimerase|nr:NAD(P)-dependent oxidoreductase [Gemmataceae bacterium]